MELLKQRILEEASVLSADVLKLDRLFNHQVDPELTMEMGREFARRFEGEGITKVITIESSGIPIAFATALTPFGRSTIELESAEDGRVVDAAFLSRGAAEQIYLAIRLALADEVETDEPLPMLLDDLFVNFDDGRLESAVGLLTRIVRERRRQIIFMTCHAHTAERLAGRMPFAKRVRIG